jgi:GcrA cell cycle regulator
MTLLEFAAQDLARSNVLNPGGRHIGSIAGRALVGQAMVRERYRIRTRRLRALRRRRPVSGDRQSPPAQTAGARVRSQRMSKATNTGRRREARPKTRHIASHLIKVAREAAEREVEEAAPEPDLDIPPHQRVPLLALTHETCRFPLGHPGDPDFGFCPNRHADGASYCARHHRLAYTPRAPARPRGERKETGWG